jgi:tetratricopeptide (TPR) repeat protein
VDEETRAQVKRLLKRGLNHYGIGELEEAIECWEQARALDPENEPVRDYLAAAYEEAGETPRSCDTPPFSQPDAEPAPATPLPAKPEDLTGPDTAPSLPGDPTYDGPAENMDTRVALALEAFRDGRLQHAWSELSQLATANPDRLDLQGYVELVRKQLLEHWAGEIGDRGRCLRRVKSDEELMALDLQPDEAFLVSQIDGSVSIDDLISLSTTDRFRSFEIVTRLLREGIVH